MKLQNMKRGETTEQITLFNWAENNKHILPCLSLMYHIPNEGKRTNGAVLKAMGLKSGVPDVCLPVPSHNFNGLYLEMKYGQNKPTKDQEAFMAALRQQGYKTAVCYGADEAKAEIMDYLQDPDKMPLSKCLNAHGLTGVVTACQWRGICSAGSLAGIVRNTNQQRQKPHWKPTWQQLTAHLKGRL